MSSHCRCHVKFVYIETHTHTHPFCGGCSLSQPLWAKGAGYTLDRSPAYRRANNFRSVALCWPQLVTAASMFHICIRIVVSLYSCDLKRVLHILFLVFYLLCRFVFPSFIVIVYLLSIFSYFWKEMKNEGKLR